jgi:5-oxoprolinase (ATP-hydrolysing) subunit C
MNALRVVSAGFAPTLQDFGRPHVQNLGVPPSGALDTTALRIANALVGNPADTAAIELRVIGPTLEVASDAVRGPWLEPPPPLRSWASVVWKRRRTSQSG